MKQRTPMKPIPGWLAAAPDKSAYFFYDRREALNFIGARTDWSVVPAEIRERPKPRRAAGKGRGE
jgi:hypothetical protein